MLQGYDQTREDALLAEIDWPQDGYRLYEIATMDDSSSEGWLHPIAESNALFMRREMWNQLGLHDERIDEDWSESLQWGRLGANTQTRPAEALFPRIDIATTA